MDHVNAQAPAFEEGSVSLGAYALELGLPVGVAAAAGFVWGHDTVWIAFAPAVFAAWWWAPSRLHAFAVAVAYHVVAGRSLIAGAERYFDLGVASAALCIVAAASVVAAVWAAWWRPRGSSSVLSAAPRLAGLWLSTYLPGVGAIAVAPPLCAAGVWFPSTGWLGLAGLFAVSLAARQASGLVVLVVLSVAGALHWAEPGPGPIAAVSTRVEPARGVFDFEAQWHVAQAAIASAEETTSRIVVLPESAAGLWHRPMQRVWRPLQATFAAQGRFALVGAALERDDGRFDNVALVLGSGEPAVYRQRAPIPFAMWTPGSSSGFAAHWGAPGTLVVGGRRLGVAICWEAALAWPLLQSVAEQADMLVVLANTAWLPDSSLRALRQNVESWGALFGLPVAIAANVHP